MKRNLDSQIALTKYHSLREFCSHIQSGKLKVKAQIELLFLKNPVKFEKYTTLYQLDPEVELKLISGKRKDLWRIYFSKHKCHPSVEKLLVHHPHPLSIYVQYHILRKTSQMEMVQLKKLRSTIKYTKKQPLCPEASDFFRTHAYKTFVDRYDKKYKH